ncbi:MAG: 2-amino-4-hydroxy-6-hydroxymethyldihydropteridine diphosphokinase [Lentisphaerae bacterium]|nr:2-amino-4-hydroxy-6-hydroxymethyldihydropteridine diphosphokinase [Lentisphaerota bacterium]
MSRTPEQRFTDSDSSETASDPTKDDAGTAGEPHHHSRLHRSEGVLEYAISMGSNLGDRLHNMQMARDRLLHDPEFTVVAQSPVYDTEPVEVAPAYQSLSYLNAVLVIESRIAPHSVMLHLHEIEYEMGRVRGADRNAPRPIDLDILYAGDIAASAPGLSIPHPRWQERRFVVEPLADVRPHHILPDDPRTVAEVLAALPSEPKVALFSRNW